jgi:predicted DNA-binding protein
MARGPQAVYDRTLKVRVTKEMDEFLDLLAARHNTSKADVVRQAIREHLDVQEDVITSRGRLGRTILRQMEMTHNQFLKQLNRISSLLLAAMVYQQMQQGARGSQVLKQITELAKRPELGRIVEGKG